MSSPALFRCNRCHRPMPGTTPADGSCPCGGLIEAAPPAPAEACSDPADYAMTKTPDWRL